MGRNYIVLDLEWNQGNEKTERQDIPFEIVEIGAVKLDSEKNILDTFDSYVRPQVYRKIHFMTKKVIHLSIQELQDADPFPEVLRRFREWCGESFLYCTWGTLDLTELQYNIRYYGLEPLSDGPIAYLDVQKLFSLALEDGKSRRSLEYAVDYLKLSKKESFHRADSDAWYTAEILRELNRPDLESRVSFDLFHLPGDVGHELHVSFDTYSKYISREFPGRAEAMRDPEVTSCRCFLCEQETKKKIAWFTLNNKYFLCLGLCREHGLMHGKLRLRKTEDGGIYVVKTIRAATEEDENNLRSRERKARIQAVRLAVAQKTGHGGEESRGGRHPEKHPEKHPARHPEKRRRRNRT